MSIQDLIPISLVDVTDPKPGHLISWSLIYCKTTKILKYLTEDMLLGLGVIIRESQ